MQMLFVAMINTCAREWCDISALKFYLNVDMRRAYCNFAAYKRRMRNPQLKQLTTFKRRITTTRRFERASQGLPFGSPGRSPWIWYFMGFRIPWNLMKKRIYLTDALAAQN